MQKQSKQQAKQEKIYIDSQYAQQLIQELESKLRIAKKILDKGGCVVVEGNEDAVITAYNYQVKH